MTLRPQTTPTTTTVATADSANSSGAFTTVARIRKTQGNRGEVWAELHTDFPELFAQRARFSLLFADGSRRALSCDPATTWFHKGGVVFHFAGVDDISAAERLLGGELQLPDAERAPAEEGAYFIGELRGCALYDVSAGTARLLGEVTDVDPSSGGAPNLVVHSKERGEILVPFVEANIVRVVPAERRIEMRLPPGLIEAQLPLSEGML